MNNSHPIKVQFFTDIDLLHPGVILEINGKRILVDPGPDYPVRKSYFCLSKYDVPNLDAIIVSHYHGDHSFLTKKILESRMFAGHIICHSATAEIMQTYYDHISEYADQFVKLDYGKCYHLFDTIRLTIFDAGHVLGSAIISIHVENKNIIITGDIGAKSLPMVRQPELLLPAIPIDLLVIDAKQVGKKRIIDSQEYPVGKILYHKIKDCFLFDEGNILIYAPLVQIPSLLYCLNFIFESRRFEDIHNKVVSIYLDPQPKLHDLLAIFKKYSYLFDKDEPECVFSDLNPLNFDKLKHCLPTETEIHNSIIITPNRNVFGKYFELLKKSEENDVLLLNNNIFYALKDSSYPINKHCNIQIKRIPFLHYHPNLEELIGFYADLKNRLGVKKLILYHYKDPQVAEHAKKVIQEEIGGDVEAVHCLDNKMVVI